jgi:hypothetical protein
MSEIGAEGEQPVKIEDVITQLDKALEGKEGIKPSEAWEFRERVRAKYKLPESGYRWSDPVRYIGEMETLLREEKIDIRNKHEFEKFFKENPNAGGVAWPKSVFRDPTIAVQAASESDWFALRAKANQLAHEGVHGFQFKLYPGMPDELAEREAYYYQMLTPQQILQYRDDPEYIYHWINEDMENKIQSSVEINKRI